MSQAALDKFIKQLSLDETLQDRLVEFGRQQGLEPGKGRLSEREIADFAVQNGFEITVEELSGRNLSEELSGQATAPLFALPRPGSEPRRDSTAWWSWLGD